MIWFSVLPLRYCEISDHLLPNSFCFSKRIKSSLIVHFPFLIFGCKILFHLSLHYFPFLIVPVSYWRFSAIFVHSLGPSFSTICLKTKSSFLLHWCLFPPSFWINNHLFRHLILSLVGTNSAILVQSSSSKSSIVLFF